MEQENQIDLVSDLNKLSNIINKININLELVGFDDIVICETIKNWELCLGILGKSALLKTKNVMKVIYCLLNDCCIINTINGNKMDLDLFDTILDRFLRFDIVNEKKR